MKELFERCLNAKYIHTAEGGDRAIEVEGGVIYLLFQWSNGAENWKSNFIFPARPYKRMDDVWYCHRGFLRAWKAMRNDIERVVIDTQNRCPMLRIAEYSGRQYRRCVRTVYDRRKLWQEKN